MFNTPEEISAIAKNHFETHVAAISGLAHQAFEGVSKIVDLNITAAKDSFEESKAIAQLFLKAQNPQEFFNLFTTQAQPNAEKAFAYGGSLAGIASTTRTELTKTAEAHIAENNRKAIELVDGISKKAPAGSESSLAFVKSAIVEAHAGYDQLNKLTKQATEAIDANLRNAIEQFTQTAIKTANRSKK